MRTIMIVAAALLALTATAQAGFWVKPSLNKPAAWSKVNKTSVF